MENILYKIQCRFYSDSTGELIFVDVENSTNPDLLLLKYSINSLLNTPFRLRDSEDKEHFCSVLRTNITVRDETGKLVPWKHLL